MTNPQPAPIPPPRSIPGFLPSRELAQQALGISTAAATSASSLHLAEPHQAAGATAPVILVPFVSPSPVAGRESLPSPAERLDVAPYTLPPGPSSYRAAEEPAVAEVDPARSADPVERARASIGIRVERLLATVAFRAAVQDEGELRISDEHQFLPWRSQEDRRGRRPSGRRAANQRVVVSGRGRLRVRGFPDSLTRRSHLPASHYPRVSG